MGQVILDFLKTNYFVVVYGITWFISVFAYKKYFDTALKYFPIIIAYTFFSELLGGVIAENENFQLIFGYQYINHNAILYNIYHLCFFLFFFFVYYNVTTIPKKKKIIKYGAGIFILVNLVNTFFQNPFIESLLYAYISGVLFLIYITLSYFKEAFQKFNFSLLKRSLLFWVSTGLLLFHSIYLPLKIIRVVDYYYYAPFRQFHLMMIVVMYLLFCFGFIVSKRGTFR